MAKIVQVFCRPCICERPCFTSGQELQVPMQKRNTTPFQQINNSFRQFIWSYYSYVFLIIHAVWFTIHCCVYACIYNICIEGMWVYVCWLVLSTSSLCWFICEWVFEIFFKHFVHWKRQCFSILAGFNTPFGTPPNVINLIYSWIVKHHFNRFNASFRSSNSCGVTIAMYF